MFVVEVARNHRLIYLYAEKSCVPPPDIAAYATFPVVNAPAGAKVAAVDPIFLDALFVPVTFADTVHAPPVPFVASSIAFVTDVVKTTS